MSAFTSGSLRQLFHEKRIMTFPILFSFQFDFVQINPACNDLPPLETGHAKHSVRISSNPLLHLVRTVGFPEMTHRSFPPLLYRRGGQASGHKKTQFCIGAILLQN